MVFGTQLKGLQLHGYRRVYLTAKMQAVRDCFLSQKMLWLFICFLSARGRNCAIMRCSVQADNSFRLVRQRSIIP